MTAVRKGHGALAIGNVLGADVLNVLFVSGTAAAVDPRRTAGAAAVFFLPSARSSCVGECSSPSVTAVRKGHGALAIGNVRCSQPVSGKPE